MITPFHCEILDVTKIMMYLEVTYIVMEFCDMDLAKLFKDFRTDINVDTSIDFCRQMASGLAHLHQHEIFHRDLKPENILVKHTENGAQLKIADFSASKMMSKLNMTQTATVKGTIRYMSPEMESAFKDGSETERI